MLMPSVWRTRSGSRPAGRRPYGVPSQSGRGPHLVPISQPEQSGRVRSECVASSHPLIAALPSSCPLLTSAISIQLLRPNSYLPRASMAGHTRRVPRLVGSVVRNLLCISRCTVCRHRSDFLALGATCAWIAVITGYSSMSVECPLRVAGTTRAGFSGASGRTASQALTLEPAAKRRTGGSSRRRRRRARSPSARRRVAARVSVEPQHSPGRCRVQRVLAVREYRRGGSDV